MFETVLKFASRIPLNTLLILEEIKERMSRGKVKPFSGESDTRQAHSA